VQSLYSQFLALAALNSFFISIKVVKYTGEIPAVKPFVVTLDDGKERNFFFALIIFLLLFGFAIFFHVVFGTTVASLNTEPGSMITLIEWMMGDYDLQPLIKVSPMIAIIFFVVFMVVFYFVAVNMFLATMINKYCDSVGMLDIRDADQRVKKSKKIMMVEYATKDKLFEDITFEIVEQELQVTEVRKDGHAQRVGIMKNIHILWKVNGDKTKWKEGINGDPETALKKIKEEGIKSKNDMVQVLFKPRTNNTNTNSWLSRFANKSGLGMFGEDEFNVRPTVKNFWRSEGAVTWVEREVNHAEQIDDKDEENVQDEGDDEKSGSEIDADEKKNHPDHRRMQQRIRIKKRLDQLLFSRWSDGRRGVDGATGTGQGWDSFGGTDPDTSESFFPKEFQQDKEDKDIAQLREDMERIPVTGQEAWLDCLVSEIERLCDDESIITNVLRTNEMQDLSMKNQKGTDLKPINDFYLNADVVCKLLEFKANKKYYQALQLESQQRQEHLKKQNEVLHEYACELEEEFTRIMQHIHNYRSKKQDMLTKLASLLDKGFFKGRNEQRSQLTNVGR